MAYVTEHPQPTRSRWQPLRGGLINLYLYDNQEFRYEDGKLLLRGNNGTGKSRVLALQLPFLLDGRVEPSRVEPDGDPAKRMEWHLLLGTRYEDRVGYSWLEFGRLNAEGEPEFLTVGIGMHAVRGRGAPKRWYFVTPARMDEQLQLVGDHGAPLLRPALEEQLAAHGGHVFASAEAYRDELDRRLFGLGRTRYEALLGLLIQLRRPQLSRKLDEAQLSNALSEALQPLAPSVLRDVADAFQNVERDRAELDACREAEGHVRAFVDDHHAYLRIEARLRAEALRDANASYEELGRQRSALERTQTQSESARESIALELPAIEERVEVLNGEMEGLRQSQAMQNAQLLQQLAEQVEHYESEEAQAAKRHQSAMTQHGRRQTERDECAAGTATVARALTEPLARAGEVLAAACMPADLHARLANVTKPEREGREGPDELEGLAQKAACATRQAWKRQCESVEHLERLSNRLCESERVCEKKTDLEDRARKRHAAAEGAFEAAQAARDTARTALGSDYEIWRAGLHELANCVPSSLTEEIAAFAEQPEGIAPTRFVAATAHDGVRDRLTAERATLERERSDVEAEIERWTAERERLARGDETPPPAAPGRDMESRRERGGAPLWKVCDFTEGLSASARAGIEAALEGAGLLDGWLPPNGDAALLGASDAFVVPLTPVEGPSLADVLSVALDENDPRAAQLDAERIHAVLASIGFGEGEGQTWVDSNGRYQLGPLIGRLQKPHPKHIGHGAREMERKHRLAEAETELARVEQQLSALEGSIKTLESRLERAGRERDSAPDGNLLHAAALNVAHAEQQLDSERLELGHAVRELEGARVAVDEARQTLSSAATELGLSDAVGRLVDVRRALDRLVDVVERWLTAIGGLVNALRAVVSANERLAEAAQAERDRRLEHERLARERARRAAQRDALEASVGQEVREVMARLEHAERAQRAATAEHTTAKNALHEREKELERVLGNLEALAPQLKDHEQIRERAAETFRTLCGTGLLEGAHDSFEAWSDALSWGSRRAVEVARAMGRALANIDTDDATRDRAKSRVQRRFVELSRALADHRLNPRLEERVGVSVVVTPLRGHDTTAAQLAVHFVDEVRKREQLLEEEEREVIENHLLDQLGLHLQQRLREAGELVAGMNREIESRPMSTGMRLKFSWDPEDELAAGWQRIRKLMGSMGSLWTPAEREEVAAFLRERMDRAREDHPGTSSEDQLRIGLDYRRWHRFRVMREQDGNWRRLTRRTHGTGSGGEKAIALTIPQLAAAAAHYGSAREDAPRLILMDEAFAGVDSDMRKKCMGLLSAFDLDVVMTSEREWGCYETVPGLAIYQLVTRPGVDAVHATRWVWNGCERIRDALPVSGAAE